MTARGSNRELVTTTWNTQTHYILTSVAFTVGVAPVATRRRTICPRTLTDGALCQVVPLMGGLSGVELRQLLRPGGPGRRRYMSTIGRQYTELPKYAAYRPAR